MLKNLVVRGNEHDLEWIIEIANKNFDDKNTIDDYKSMFKNINYDFYVIRKIAFLIIIKTDILEIYKICSDEKKKGYGTLLLNLLKMKTRIEVNVNNFNAISFYKNNNFKIVGTRKNYYNNDDAIIMERE